MSRFFLLLGKELREERNWILFSSIALFLLFALFLLRSGKWHKGSATVIYFLIVSVSIFILSIVRGFGLLKKEWDSRTIIYLRSLPAGGYEVALSKFTSFVVQIGLFAALGLILNYWLFSLESLDISGFGFRSFFLVYVSAFFGSLVFFSVPFIAYVVSKSTARLGKLLSISVLLALVYIIPKLHKFFVRLLPFLPKFQIFKPEELAQRGLTIHPSSADLASYIFFTVISLALILLSGFLLEKKVEI